MAQQYVYGGATCTMAGATSAPTSTGVYMLAHGSIKAKGVVAPEGYVAKNNFARFMTELKRRAI